MRFQGQHFRFYPSGITGASKVNSRYGTRQRNLASTFIGLALFTAAFAKEERKELPRRTLAEALELAKTDQKLVFVKVMSSNCSHCLLFQNEVLTSNVFREFARGALHIVIYDITRESDLSASEVEELRRLMTSYQVKYTPTILVFSPNGEALMQTQGYEGTPPETLVRLLGELQPSAE